MINVQYERWMFNFEKHNFLNSVKLVIRFTLDELYITEKGIQM